MDWTAISGILLQSFCAKSYGNVTFSAKGLMIGLRPSKLCFDIGKKGENVGNFRLISGLLLLEIGVVG